MGGSLLNLDLDFVSDFTEGLKDMAGAGAKDAANNEVKQAKADQLAMESKLYNKAQLDKAQEENFTKRAQQKAKSVGLGGRASTILTRGLNAPQGQMDAGKKVLLGE